MKSLISSGFRRMFIAASIIGTLAQPALFAADASLPAVAKASVSAPVTVTDNGGNWTLDNGIVKATINKRNSHITSLVYHGVNIMGPGGIWEQVPSGQVTQSVTIDPAKNGGQRADRECA